MAKRLKRFKHFGRVLGFRRNFTSFSFGFGLGKTLFRFGDFQFDTGDCEPGVAGVLKRARSEVALPDERGRRERGRTAPVEALEKFRGRHGGGREIKELDSAE